MEAPDDLQCLTLERMSFAQDGHPFRVTIEMGSVSYLPCIPYMTAEPLKRLPLLVQRPPTRFDLPAEGISLRTQRLARRERGELPQRGG